MNWADTAVLVVVAVSAMVAFSRGFVREMLGIGAWVGAFFFASGTVGLVRPTVHHWIANPDIANPAAFIGMFLIGLIALSILTGMIGGAVRRSILGGLDRTLGVVFGILRGIVLVSTIYVVVGWVVPTENWPAPVQESRSLPYAYGLAVWLSDFLPTDYRPHVPVPPTGAPASASDLLRATPQGKATTSP
ncbi:MAG: CvpA family protein [Rhodospirillales bacterium]|nr:CvpA family protein [Rhodospirillales bacterium]MDE2198186.1 CvpA family protein [Rhodospirillales bacterium]MDE2573798.1 CvpA family protein [Rhodospirillales bacterium]